MAITLLGPFRNASSSARSQGEDPQSESAQTFEGQRRNIGRQLIQVAAAEQSAQSTARAEAWVQGWLGDRNGEAVDWASYLGRIQALSGEASISELKEITREAPSDGSTLLRELGSAIEEQDQELFAESLLSMARRNLEHRPQFAVAALYAASEFPSTTARAQSLLAVLEGHGSFGDQFELQAPRLLRELTSPLALASFGTGIFLSRAVSLATLTRFSRLGWGSLLASEGAALAVEAPAMVLTHRIGDRMLHGGAATFTAQSLGHDVLAAYAPFALLRLSGNALVLGAPWLRRNLMLEGAAGGRVFSGLRFGAELGSLMLGHRFNATVGLEQSVSGSQALYQGLLSLGHMRISGRIVEAMGLGSLGSVWESQRHELLRRSRETIFFDGDMGSGLAFAGIPSRRFAPPRARNRSLNPEPMFMTKDGDSTPPNSGGGNGGGGKGGGSEHSRTALALQLFGQSLGEYSREYENRESFLGKVAGRLQKALEKPELMQDPSFANALHDMEVELEAASEHGSAARTAYERLKVLFGRNQSEAEPVIPPEAKEEIENIAHDEDARSSWANGLAKMREILQKARQFGWNEELYDQLRTARNHLNNLYRNSSAWKIPGLDRLLRRADPEAVLQRRQGAVLGLAVLNGHETATVRALRDPSAPPSANGNLALELLHQSMLTAARRRWEPDALDSEILGLASRFGADEEATAAMMLSAAAVQRMVQGGPRNSDLLEFLEKRDESIGHFADRFLQVRAFRAAGVEPGRGLVQLAGRKDAEDYWFSGLQLYLQTQGDPARLAEGLETARRSRMVGFHPSIAVTLFGAAHGRQNLPPKLWASDFNFEGFLERALEPEIK